MMMKSLLVRATTRRLPMLRTVLISQRAVVSTTIPHLAGHPGPTGTKSSSTTNKPQSNPSEEARQAAELMRKLQEDPVYLKKIHDDQPMYFKPAGPDSLPGDQSYHRRGGEKKQES